MVESAGGDQCQKKMSFVKQINTEGDLKDRIKSETKVQIYKTPSPIPVKSNTNLPKALNPM